MTASETDRTHRVTFGAAWVATFLINIAWGSTFPLLNVYIHDRGVSLLLIGTLSTAGSVAFSLAGILFGRLSDRLGRRRELIMVMLLVGAAGLAGYLWARTFLHFLALSLIDMAMIGGYTVLIDTLVTSILPEKQRGGDFGRYRISGSLGFALAGALLGSVTGAFGIEAVFVIAALAQAAAAVAIIFTREPARVVPLAATPAVGEGLWRTLTRTGLLWLLAADLVAIFGAQLAYPFMNIYTVERFGASANDLGWLSTIGVLAEIPAMLGLGRLSDRLGRGSILAFGFLTSALSWLLVYAAPGLWLMYVARPLMGISIIRYTVGVALISDRVPYEQRATLLGLSNLTFGAGGLIAPSIGGLFAESLGIRQVFLVAFVVQALATLLFVLTMRRGQPVVSPADAS